MSTYPPTKACKDCLAEWVANGPSEAPLPVKRQRPAPHPGPRCTTHHRGEVKRRKAAAHENRVQKVYGLAPGEYWGLYRYQNGRCAICRRATGATKNLAVDHDHATGKPRGLCCGPCNKLLGMARDSVEFFERCANYLESPPYQEWTREA